MIAGSGRSRRGRGRLCAWLGLAALGVTLAPQADATPHVPSSDDTVLADLPAGARYTDLAARRLAQGRIDVALPLAQFYIHQSRLSGDLRYLGYADAVLAPWRDHRPPAPQALVLYATLQQSRHEFDAALATLEQALRIKPDDPQALLTQATIFRVLGRYADAGVSCERFSRLVEPRFGTLCTQTLRGLTGQLDSAYASLQSMSTQGWLETEKSWLYSELGEMAVRLGQDAEAERWFKLDLELAPADFYVRGAYADLLLQQGRAVDALQLLQGQESFEPLLLRIAIAQQQLRDPKLAQSRARLEAAFAAELQRGEAVHRREQARFLLTVQQQPQLALDAARENWRVQREPDDARVLVAAARAAGNPGAAAAAIAVLSAAGVRAARLDGEPASAGAAR
jgi:tetratricopeptide (TPR) repeat protein